MQHIICWVGMRLGEERGKTYFWSPKAINRMNNSDNVRTFRQALKAHFAIFEKWLSLENGWIFPGSLLVKRKGRGCGWRHRAFEGNHRRGSTTEFHYKIAVRNYLRGIAFWHYIRCRRQAGLCLLTPSFSLMKIVFKVVTRRDFILSIK